MGSTSKELEVISFDQEEKTVNHDHEDTIPDLSGDSQETEEEFTSEKESKTVNKERSVQKLEEMKEVMQHGMSFLAGMYKMSTGKEIGMDQQKLDINTETGEIIMKFKLPV